MGENGIDVTRRLRTTGRGLLAGGGATIVVLLLLAPTALAGIVLTTWTSPYPGGCAFSTSWQGASGNASFTAPSYSAGTGGINASETSGSGVSTFTVPST